MAVLTINQVQERIDSVHGPDIIKIVGDYKSRKDPASFECIHGHKWKTRLDDIIIGKGCPYCAGNARYTKEEIQKQINDVHGFENILLIGEYNGANSKTDFQCNVGHVWQTTPSSIKNNGSRCPICNSKIIGQLETQKRIDKKHGYGKILIIGEYISSSRKALLKCTNGHIWKSLLGHIIRGVGCPFCANSGFNHNIPAYVYCFKFKDESGFNVGITTKTPLKRYNKMCREKMDLIFSFKFDKGFSARNIEHKLIELGKLYPYTGNIHIKKSGKREFIDINAYHDICCIFNELELKGIKL